MSQISTHVSLNWYAPLNRIMGKTSHEVLDGETSVEDLLIRLREREPQLAAYAKWDEGDIKPWGLLLLRGSDMLRLKDVVQPGDSLDVLIMMDGG